MSFIIFKDNREQITNALPENIIGSLSEKTTQYLLETFPDWFPKKIIKSIPKNFIDAIPLNVLLETIPDLLDGEVFGLFFNHYLGRLNVQIPSGTPVDLTHDSKIVKFSDSTMYNLLDATNPGERIVFRFLCDYENSIYSNLNITPVIMDNTLSNIVRHSLVDGNGTAFADKAEVNAKIANYENRLSALGQLMEFRHDRCGIYFEIPDYIKEVRSEAITVFLTLETLRGAFHPAISIAITRTAEYTPYERKFDEFIKRVAIYNHGSECC